MDPGERDNPIQSSSQGWPWLSKQHCSSLDQLLMPYGTPAVDQMVLNYNASYKVNTRNCNLHIAAMYFKSLDLIILQTLRQNFIISRTIYCNQTARFLKQPH